MWALLVEEMVKRGVGAELEVRRRL